MSLFPATIFLSALLLFLVQPLVGKAILPWFGGTPAVWVTCMLFFQVTLLAGYAYAHGLATRFSPRMQGVLHLLLLAVTLAFVPIVPSASWAPAGDAEPTLRILILLAATIGLPFLVLASTGPLVQKWFAVESPGRSPYRLYALSNAASLLALLAYPFALERGLRLPQQDALWTGGYVLFVLSCGGCAVRQLRRASGRAAPSSHATDATAAARPTRFTIGVWLALAACASTLLLATTNQLCVNVAVVPFLWVLPLALYLVTFILCFDSDRWYRRERASWALLAALAAGVALWFGGAGLELVPQVVLYAAVLFVGCMVCHGELAASRPDARYLTSFYLWVAAGGALGGILVGLVAPAVFDGYWEFPLALLSCCVLLIVARRRVELERVLAGRKRLVALGMPLVAALGLSAAGVSHDSSAATGGRHGVRETRRNFYGVLQVYEQADEAGSEQVVLRHGTTLHGTQFLGPGKRRLPTAYYGPDSGVGLALKWHPRRPAGLRIGAVGLGAGTVATYAEPGDLVHFFEIDGDVLELAREHFTYLDDAEQRGADVEVSLGDARLVLEDALREAGPMDLDVLVLDAFSSDAVPVHLLTREAFRVYERHLAAGGVLAVHVSNKYLDLAPVVRGAAAELGKEAVSIQSRRDRALGREASEWIVVAEEEFLALPAVTEASRTWPADARAPRVWTDDFSSLFPLLD